MKIFFLLIMTSIAILFTACNSSETIEPEQENILIGTFWLRKDIASEIIYGGGDNYLKLTFKKDNFYEIVRVKADKVNSLQEEGTYTLTDNKDVILTTEKNEQKTSLRYVLVNNRTLHRVTETGEILTNAYEAYIMQ